MDSERIIRNLKPLVQDLVNDKLLLIQKTDRSGPYTAEELKELIEEYGGELTSPPQDDYTNINIIEIADDPEYVVEYDLWVDGEKSDLTLSCSVRLFERMEKISINNIHVL
jgi:hypothetical protein